MSYCKRRQRYNAELSIAEFFRQNKAVWFLTFTEPGRNEGRTVLPDGRVAEVIGTEVYWTKTQAEEHFKPFEDWLRRRGAKHLVFWERQKRGAWHPHVLVNKYCDVKAVRWFMMDRGWGQIMKFKRVVSEGSHNPKGHGESVAPEQLTRYLIKYLTKAYTCEPRKKFFGGSRGCLVAPLTGSLEKGEKRVVLWKWNPWLETPHGYLYEMGVEPFNVLYGRAPTFCDVRECMRLGYQVADWGSVDPWYDPPSYDTRYAVEDDKPKRRMTDSKRAAVQQAWSSFCKGV